MKIGYPCINRTVKCNGNKTFRLRSYSDQRLTETVQNNLACLQKVLKYNIRHNILFFRISSDLVPFASHPVCKFDWQGHFSTSLNELGDLIRQHDIRISMHPDQFIVLNTPRDAVLESSLLELRYHSQLLDLMELDTTAKIQLHVGGVYGDRDTSIKRFIDRYKHLEPVIQRRLVIENDDRSYQLEDCLRIHQATGIPVLFDWFHHQVLNSGESLPDGLKAAARTWRSEDGTPMVDYSSQEPGKIRGKHAQTLDPHDFRNFLALNPKRDLDLMLEIKDKEKSALKALKLLRNETGYIKN
ncbi:UV DNA damage repair endonuclease UvsE [bacterium]|nr:UV DNA damage repair endonuclease UvsE [bacterium]